MPVTQYVWNPLTDAYLMETDGAGNPTAVYTQEPKPYGGLISQRRNGETSYYHQDALGSTVQLTDADENVTDEYVYSAYGEAVAQSGSTVNPFRWIGRVGYYHDEATGNYYVRARNYAPEIGRWKCSDPLLFFDGPNCYVMYAIPNSSDPTGLTNKVCSCFRTRGGGGAGGAVVHTTSWRIITDSSSNCASACCPEGTGTSIGGGTICACGGNDAGPDTDRLYDLCDKLSCPGCTPEACRQLMDGLTTKALETSVFPIWTERCQAWAFKFERCLPPLLFLHPCVKNAEVKRVSIERNLGLTTGHAVYKITFCDGTVVYFDIGTFGGPDHIFFPGDPKIPDDVVIVDE